MIEEFVFYQCGWDSRAVDGYEGVVHSVALVMNCLGDDFFFGFRFV